MASSESPLQHAGHPTENPQKPLADDDDDDDDLEAWADFGSNDDSEDENEVEAASGLNGQANGGWSHGASTQESKMEFIGTPSIKGGSETLKMVLLNFATLGITITWGVEMTYCTPYLLALGLTKSMTSLVWIAGPLSGLVVQPIVGAIADESKSRWGRRRPYILVGAAIGAVCLLVLGFTKEIVGLFIPEGDTAKTFTIVLAIVAIYAVDFSVNAVMSASKSLVADTLVISRQQDGNAWGGRISAVGHMLGYIAGAVDLVSLTGGFLGGTQFAVLTVFAATSILGTCALTCWAVTERVLVSTGQDSSRQGRFRFVRQIWHKLLHLPPRIQAICWAQFWAWIGWFPFMFYNTTWIGETYFRYEAPEEAKKSKDILGDMGRIGSSSLVIYASITLAGAWLLPLLVTSPEKEGIERQSALQKDDGTILGRVRRYRPNLLTTWMIGHGLFAGAMFLAPFARSYAFATFLLCVCGLPWTLAMWAPPTFIGIEVNRLSGATEIQGPYQRLAEAPMEMEELNGADSTRPEDRDVEASSDQLDPATSKESSGELSGIYFGILNIYTTLPQFVGTFISAIVFAILEPGKSPELAQNPNAPDDQQGATGPNAIGVCLFIGAISATIAIYATRRLKYL